jgi:maltose alpha-D-glucosyltransferase/alpha-amylase
VEAYAPGTLLLSEANQWPEDVRPYFGNGDEFHMNFHFPLMPRIFMALARADRSPIEEIMARTPALPDPCQWGTFLRCHDELTLEMVTPEEREFMWNYYAPEPRMRLNLGIRRRLAPLLNGDRRKIELANAMLFALPGSPFLYYGDEIGMGDNIWLEDRDGVRTPMQWSDEPNAGFSTAAPTSLYLPLIDDDRFGYRRVNVKAQRVEAGSLWHTLRKLLSVRKGHLAFGEGSFEFLENANRAVLALARTGEAETIVAVNNLSPLPQQLQLDLHRWKGMRVRDLLADRVWPSVPAPPEVLTLQPYEYAWLELGH